MAGTAFGETNETASIFCTPVRDSASISRMRSSTDSGGSACRPSRGPTSRTVTRSGSAGGGSGPPPPAPASPLNPRPPPRRPREPTPPPTPPPAGAAPAGGSRHPEPRVVARHDQVARERQLEPPAQCDPEHGGDRGQGHIADRREHRGHPLAVLEPTGVVEPVSLLQVGADAERL